MKRSFSLITKFNVRIRQHGLSLLRSAPVHENELLYLGGSPGEILMVNFAGSAQELLNDLQSPQQKAREGLLRDEIVSDWSRQLLRFVTTAKDSEVPLEKSAYLQLRYIEVPGRVYSEYSDWRESTIFAHVREQAEIESFHAYHTLLSTQPGVLFLSGFSCSEDQYDKCFNNPHYHEIVRDAGSRFIVDGVNGLYTRIYRRA